MAAPETRSRARPLSPHLQVYRWQVQMVTSILHRATGMALVAGGLAMVWGLAALAAGPESWADFTACVGSLLGQVLLFAFSWALAYHLINGIRHLVQDAGYAYKVDDFVRNSWFSVVGSLVVTALIWLVAMTQRGAA